MGWLKRNLFVILVVATALCAVGALVLEPVLNPRPPVVLESTQAPTAANTAEAGSSNAANADGKGFQNKAEPATEPVENWPEYREFSAYELALVLDPDDRKLHGTMDFTYLNEEDEPMDRLHFLLYPNSFEKEYYGVFEDSETGNAYPNGFSPGSIAIGSVTSPEGKVEYLVTGEQKHVLEVKLVRPVEPGQKTRLTIEYTVTVPNCLGRFGYGDNTMSLVNCHPILSVYDGQRWYDYPYYKMGDPFFSETADYRATITAPAEWTIAATGVLTRKESGSDSVWTVDAPARRDFGFVASDAFEVMQADANGVLVRSYYLAGDKGSGRKALDCAVESLALYGEAFGEYPYAEFSVVEADFFIGGMEYPGMVLIDQSLYGQDVILDLVVAHETGHQWWYSTIGGDEVAEPWLDEGLTEFSTQYFFEQERDESYNDYYRTMIDWYQEMRIDQEGQFAVTLPASSFDDGATYSAWIYDRMAQILHELRAEIGDEAFFAGLRSYYAANRLGIATREDLEQAFETQTGRELTQWFEDRFASSGTEVLFGE